MRITELTALRLAELIHSGELTSLEVTEAFLRNIEENDRKYNSFITVARDEAVSRAKAADERIKSGEILSALDGVPIAVKDNIITAEIKTTCASKMLQSYVPPYDAAVVERLYAAGLVILGKTNMDEFSMGSSSDTSYFGAVHNPWNTDCVPGGSSGGSVAAVSAGLAPLALGSDTGGSVRQPASMCGVCGMKPTYGAVSRYGLVAYANSLDQIGVVGKNTADCAALLDIISAKDTRDSTYVGVADGFSGKLCDSVFGKKIGVPRECIEDGIDSGVKSAFLASVETMRSLGCEIEFFDFPLLKYVIPCYYVISNAEASTNLSRYDGVRYGYRPTDFAGTEDMMIKSRSEGFGAEVKKRIMLGTMSILAENYEDYYKKALDVKSLLTAEFDRCFDKYDMVMCPTAPSVAGLIGVSETDSVKRYLADIYTVPANIAGLPAISVPCGFGENSMPVGVQFIGRKFDDSAVLGFASAYQSESDWHTLSPLSIKGEVSADV